MSLKNCPVEICRKVPYDEAFCTNDIGVIFGLMESTADVIIDEIDLVVWEGDAEIVDSCQIVEP